MVLAAGLLVVALVSAAPAQSPGCMDGQHRTGNPWEIAPWARPSDTGRYVGYYVGGGSGSKHKADAPLPDEGTWGWDYQGWFPRHIILGWWHGRRYQGGTGAYKTDGPILLHPFNSDH
jgi:hypothetical protein